jgi:DNA primase
MTFTETLDLYGIEWRPSDTNADEISICCPFCIERGETEDSRFRLGINIRNGKAHDFNCDWASSINTFSKILEALQIEAEDTEEEQVKEVKKVEFNGKLPEEYEPLWPLKRDKDFLKAYNYLKNRYISDKQIEKYKIGFCLAGRYSYRIIFPVYQGNELCALITRDFTDKQKLRYLNSIGKKTLYGIRKKKQDAAVLVEGAIDKLSGERIVKDVDWLGIPGRTLHDNQIDLLKDYKRIIRIPDDDRPGIKGAMKDCNKLLESKLNVQVSFLDTKFKDINKALVDGGSKGRKAVERLIVEATPYSEYTEKMLKLKLAIEYRGAREIHE